MTRAVCMTRRTALAMLAAATACPPASGKSSADPATRTVVELFTSQGCSSCPPADEVLADIRRIPGVVALAYHVDYWDYLGWKDTLAMPEFSQRQYDYARARGDMDVYTPQAIINGGRHVVASHRAELSAAVHAARSERLPIQVSLSVAADEIAIEIDTADMMEQLMVWLLPVQARVTVNIVKGENAGKTFDYRSVVRRIVPAGMWAGHRIVHRLPTDAVMTSDSTGCVALVQRGKAGRILGLAVAGQIDV